MWHSKKHRYFICNIRKCWTYFFRFESDMFLKVLFILIFLWQTSIGYKMLFALPTLFKSHYQFGNAIAKTLAEKGHEVTVISPFKQSKSLPNYKEVYLELTQQAYETSKLPKNRLISC